MKKDEVLKILKISGDYVSGRVIAEKLSLSRVSVNNVIKSLKSDGYRIESVTNRGYKLVDSPDVITKGELSVYLNADVLDKVICLDEISSTNDYLKKLASTGEKNGVVVVSNEQTSGKGRMGKSFYSPKDCGIYMSYLLRPTVRVDKLSNLTGNVAVAVQRAIRCVCGLDLGIKWVNDLVYNRKKVCGILTELSVVGETMTAEYAVIGIGINVNNDASAFSGELKNIATSLYAESGKKYNRSKLVAEIIKNLNDLFEDYSSNPIDEYRSLCVNFGKQVVFTRDGEQTTGLCTGIDDDYCLIVETDIGVLRLYSGEVSIRSENGYSD